MAAVPALVTVDLLVPEAVGGGGRRGARLGVHGNDVARKARGLEAALIDKSDMVIGSLDRADARSSEIAVAGPAALIVAKVHKIAERVATRRGEGKDALDLLRLLRAIPTGSFAERFRMLLASPVSGAVTSEGLEHLEKLFGRAGAAGSRLAAEAAAPLDDPDTIAASCEALALDLLKACRA